MQLKVVDEARACRHCAGLLPHEPRPVLRAGHASRIAVIGQAPGAVVHQSGEPWEDASGEHLREWLDMDLETFRDPDRLAILPMGFCWPGRKKGGDLPPRAECAPLWHARILDGLPDVRLHLLIGQYAVAYYLGQRRKPTLGSTVQHFRDYLPRYFPLPHPSWRSRHWMAKNPWFGREVLPALRAEVSDALRGSLGR